MPKRFFRRYLPRDTGELDQGGSLRRVIGRRLADPNLWHLNRRSISGGMAIGLFLAWMPIPFQMMPAALIAILLRMNLPTAVVLVWVSNPLTWGPMYWSAYRLGIWLLDREPRAVEDLDFKPETAWFFDEMLAIWQPLLLGCTLLAVISATAGYALTRIVWRLHIVSWIAERRRQRKRRINRHRDRGG